MLTGWRPVPIKPPTAVVGGVTAPGHAFDRVAGSRLRVLVTPPTDAVTAVEGAGLEFVGACFIDV
jgi:hypothetical protein